MFQEKLTKQLSSALVDAGITEPLPLQAQLLSKINAGADVYGIGANGIGKTTLAVITTIHKLKFEFEDAPRALIVVESHEKALAMQEQFALLGKNTNLRIKLATDTGKIIKQFEDIYFGSDVVIGTSKRLVDIYIRYNLNVNKIKTFIIDDAEGQIKQALQGQVDRLSQSLPKCQHLIFANELNAKIERLTEQFMVNPQLVEIT